MSNLAVAVSRATISAVEGAFQCHSSPRVTTLVGQPGWWTLGAPGAFPVLYVGRPIASVMVEAYRHLVDDAEGMTGDKVGPRTLWTCEVTLTNVLDLRKAASRDAVSFTLDNLTGPVDQYERCQRVAQAAYQLQLHGIIAPPAGGNGETLALFKHHLPANEFPIVVRQETWEHLPADPRRLRGIAGGAASG